MVLEMLLLLVSQPLCNCAWSLWLHMCCTSKSIQISQRHNFFRLQTTLDEYAIYGRHMGWRKNCYWGHLNLSSEKTLPPGNEPCRTLCCYASKYWDRSVATSKLSHATLRMRYPLRCGSHTDGHSTKPCQAFQKLSVIEIQGQGLKELE